MAFLAAALSLLLLAASSHAAPLTGPAAKHPAALPAVKHPAAVKHPREVVKVPRKVLPVSRITAVCTSQAQNPPYKVVNCNVENPFNVTVCLHLACSPIVPGGCPTGPGAAGSSNEACAWNVKPPGTTLYPVQAGTTWNFGWSTTDPARVTCRPVGPGFSLLAPGVYTC